MAVSEDDVRHVAALARLGLDPSRLPALVNELNGILAHMEDLQAVESGGERWDVGETRSETPMRSDIDAAPIPLSIPRETFAPDMLDGFFLVPRLATHEGDRERSP